MPTTRPPILPRIGFLLLNVLFSLSLAVFVLLFFVVPDERWNFLLPAAGMLLGLSWTRSARRGWLTRHEPSTAEPT